MTREEKREQWQGIVARWQSSGMRQAAWCRQEAVAVASLRQWVVKLRAPQTPKKVGGFVQFDFADSSARAVGCDLLMEVRFGSWSLSLPLAASEGDIRKVLQALAAIEVR
jgi:hypothetical protein